MTRVDIMAELLRTCCDWRVTLEDVRGAPDKLGTPHRLTIAARAVFIRKMFAEAVPAGHVAWALNIHPKNARLWYQRLREAEKAWWRDAPTQKIG